MDNNKNVIMIVDDDQDMLDSMRLLLETNDYLVIEANSAEEGIVVYQEKLPDLIIVDLMMEEVDAGTVLVKELKALGCTVPIYLLSSIGDSLSIATPYSELGLSGVFQKPVDFKSLLHIIKVKLAS